MRAAKARLISLPVGVALALGAGVVTATGAQAATGCRVDYTVSAQWSGGFTGNVNLTNLGDLLNGWTLTWTFTAGQQVTQGWNADISQSGSAVSAANASWNGSLGNGTTVTFGFNGSWNSDNPVPTSFVLNGVTCTGSTTGDTTAPPTMVAPTTAAPTTAAPTTGAPTTTPPTTPPPDGTVLTVAPDGSGDYRTVQAAVDAVPGGNSHRVTIEIEAGTYQGAVSIPSDKPYISFVGMGPSASSVVISDNRASGTPKPGGGTYGTSGSASVTVDGHDFIARNLTFANTFDEASSTFSSNQAVAVLTRTDRLIFDNVRFLGNQDTLYLNSASTSTIGRSYLHNCYVEGDVDFIFGRGTAVFDHCEIHSLDRGSSSNNGYVTAASTDIGNPYGFLFSHCALTSDAPSKTVYLGRPWHPSGDVNAIAQVVYRDSTLGAHIKDAPWTDMSGFSWQDARFFEYHNSGPGAGVNSDRPQLTDSQATGLTPQAYLAGGDNWDPIS